MDDTAARAPCSSHGATLVSPILPNKERVHQTRDGSTPPVVVVSVAVASVVVVFVGWRCGRPRRREPAPSR
jgi:hypothetical protein